MNYVHRTLNMIDGAYERLNDAALILIYHRVNELDADPQLLAVSPKNFEAQMKYLQENYLTISLQELVRSMNTEKVPKNAVVVTFDDGYTDNLYHAKPIMEKYGVPGTVFVTTGMVNSTREFWWDELERIFLADSSVLNRTLGLVVGQTTEYLHIDSKDKALEVYKRLHSLLMTATIDERQQFLDELLNWAGVKPDGRISHRCMNGAELLELAKGGLIEIGAHTVNHGVLARETPERQRWEIDLSKKALEDILGMQVKSFSYPFGGIADISPNTPALVKEVGFNCGIANYANIVTGQANAYWLPRCLVRNWSIHEFQAFMDACKRTTEGKFFALAKQQFIQAVEKNDVVNNNSASRISLSDVGESEKESKNSCNVLQINEVDNAGGAAMMAFALHNCLRKQGYGMKMLVDKMFTSDKDIDFLPQGETSAQKIVSLLQQEWGGADLFYLSSFLLKRTQAFQQCQIVHLHNLHYAYFSYLALPELSKLKPVVWTLHDMQAITGHCAHSFACDMWIGGCNNCPNVAIYPPIKRDTSWLLWNAKKEIYRECGRLTIVCPSNWLKMKVENSILGQHEIRLVYNGVDETMYHNFDKQYAKQVLQLPVDKQIVLSAAGSLDNPWKGGEYARELSKRFQHRKDILFINLGGNQSGLVNENWLELGYISDPEKMALLYSAAELLLYPSVADNCPLVVLEALSCGTPVLAFRTGGIPELVEHLQTGYIADYQDLNDFMNGFDTLIGDQAQRVRMSAQARRTVLQRFTLKKMVEEYINIYSQLCNEFKK